MASSTPNTPNNVGLNNQQFTQLMQSVNQMVNAMRNMNYQGGGGSNTRSRYSNLNLTDKEWRGIQKLSNFGNSLKAVYGVGKDFLNVWGKIDQAAADFSKQIGMSAAGMEKLRKSAISLVKDGHLGAFYNVSAEQLIKMQESFAKAVGRNIQLGKDGLTSLAATSKLLGEQGATDLMAKLENFGISMSGAGDIVGKMFSSASKKGVVFQKTSENFLNNIKLAQNYTFKNGINGLASMAEKAAAIKLDMSQATSFAEKVNSVENAITTGAGLQVLGGPFSQFSNPLQMLNESLNDVEGLQDRITKMFGSFGTFNQMTGQMEVSAFNRMRIKAAAEQMGLDYSNVMESIYSQGRGKEIERQLGNNPNNLSKDTIELLKNVGSFENGVAGVNINGEFKRISEIQNSDAREIKKINQSQSDDIKDIAKTLRGWNDSIEGFKTQKENLKAQLVETTGLGNGVKNIIQGVSETNKLLGWLLGVSTVGSILSAGGVFRNLGTFITKTGGISNALSTIALNTSGGALGTLGGLAGAAGAVVGGVTAYKGYKDLKNLNEERKNGNIYRGSIEDKNRVLSASGKLGSGIGAVGGYATFATLSSLGLASSFAGAGMSIGSAVPVIGTAIGALVGAGVGWAVGAIKNKNNEVSYKIRQALFSEYNLELKGDYKKKEMQAIEKLLEDDRKITQAEFDSLSEKTKQKIKNSGDLDRINELNAKAEDGTFHINNAIIYTSKSSKGGKHAAVGMAIPGFQTGGHVIGIGSATSDNIPAMLSPGETVMNAGASRQFGSLLDSMNSMFSGGAIKRANGGPSDSYTITTNTKALATNEIKEVARTVVRENANTTRTMNGDIKIDFSPIKVEFPNGTSKDISDLLLSNGDFMKKMTNMISEGIQRNANGGRFNVTRPYNNI